MGNVSYRFLITLFSSTLWIFVFINLCTWSGFNATGFLGMEFVVDSNSIFGFSSFYDMISAIRLTEDGDFSIADTGIFVNIDHFGDYSFKGVWWWFTKVVSFATLNIPQTIANLVDLGEVLAKGFVNAQWTDNILSNIQIGFTVLFDNITIIGKAFMSFCSILLAPLQLVFWYLPCFIGHVSLLAFTILVDFFGGLSGAFNRSVSSIDNTSWQEVVDGWQSQWDNLTALL